MKAVIFDMDGVIVDSEKHWKKAELNLFGQLVSQWTVEDQQKIIGLNVKDTFEILKSQYNLKESEEVYMAQVTEIANHVYEHQANLTEGFSEVIKEIHKQNIPIGLASSSLKSWITTVLNRFQLTPYFQVVVSAEEINAPGKPAPDIYLYAAKKLGVLPKDCVVIEDSTHGVASAKSAGMTCIGIRNGFNDHQDLSKANQIINGFKEFNLNQYLIKV